MTAPDYRAALAELTEAVYADGRFWEESLYEIANRARALLAAPEAVGMTDEEILELAYSAELREKDGTTGYREDADVTDQVLAFARAVLARYGARPAPVPVGERLPGVGDCDAEGCCWFWDYGWTRQRRGWHDNECTHWLPHWALPLPEAQP
jgi:hypothetical protein